MTKNRKHDLEIERLQWRIHQTSQCIIWLCNRGMRPFVTDTLMDEIDAEIKKYQAENEANRAELARLLKKKSGSVV